jgi:uncharacterized protein (DUF58 family)
MDLFDMLSHSIAKKPRDLRSRKDSSLKGKPGRIHFSPTRYGWLFVVVLLGLLVGSINYNNNLGFLFTFLLGSMMLVSLVHSYRNIRGIAVDDIQARPVFETQDAIFEINLPGSRAKRVALVIRLGDSQETSIDMAPGDGSRVAIAVTARKRGRLSPGGLHMVSEYPFGLFGCHTRCQCVAECLVYPKPVPIQKLSMQDLLQAHSSQGAGLENVDDFKGLRRFQNGDATQHIFWKAFSKGQGLMVKEFMGHATPSLCFSWDKIKTDNVEKKLSLLCGMVLKAHGMKLSYGIHLPGRLITPDKGEQHKHACLRALALF